MRYIEKAVGVLSELENANVLGHLLGHSQEITRCNHAVCPRCLPQQIPTREGPHLWNELERVESPAG